MGLKIGWINQVRLADRRGFGAIEEKGPVRRPGLCGGKDQLGEAAYLQPRLTVFKTFAEVVIEQLYDAPAESNEM